MKSFQVCQRYYPYIGGIETHVKEISERLARKGFEAHFTPHYHDKWHTFLRNLLHIPYKFLARGIFDKANTIAVVSNFEQIDNEQIQD